MNCVPESLLEGEIPDFDVFLSERRKLMAQRMRVWFEASDSPSPKGFTLQ
jgi:hypothetical protein